MWFFAPINVCLIKKTKNYARKKNYRILVSNDRNHNGVGKFMIFENSYK